jgi:hypothetical protein
MNSDFMQQQAERLAERVIAEPTDAARIQKAYKLIFGRVPTAAELKAGQEFLDSEPMRQYEEKKAEAEKAAKKDAEGAGGAEAMKKPGATPPAAPGATPPAAVPDGMMSGVTLGAPGMKDEKEKKPVTPLGRYIKVLLSSNEFLFIN